MTGPTMMQKGIKLLNRYNKKMPIKIIDNLEKVIHILVAGCTPCIWCKPSVGLFISYQPHVTNDANSILALPNDVTECSRDIELTITQGYS